MSRIFYWVRRNAIIPMFWSGFGMAVVGYATYRTFTDLTLINAAVTGALGVVYGLPSIAIAAWQWRLGWKEKNESERE